MRALAAQALPSTSLGIYILTTWSSSVFSVLSIAFEVLALGNRSGVKALLKSEFEVSFEFRIQKTPWPIGLLSMPWGFRIKDMLMRKKISDF